MPKLQPGVVLKPGVQLKSDNNTPIQQQRLKNLQELQKVNKLKPRIV